MLFPEIAAQVPGSSIGLLAEDPTVKYITVDRAIGSKAAWYSAEPINAPSLWNTGLYDNGELKWRFRTIPHPGEQGYESWPKDAWKTAGAANNWAGMSLDEKRGIVYVPTGSAVPDFYGGARVGNDLFADSLLALNASTGKLLWHFQGVHHDLWDRDFPAPTALVTVKQDGHMVDAIAQTTKQGFLFLLDRTTGKPLFPVEERPVPSSDVPGEVASPTQPIPLAPAPYARQSLNEDMLTNRTPEAHAWALKEYRTFRNKGLFTPLAVGEQTLVVPGFDGGAEWGGPAVDPESDVIYVVVEWSNSQQRCDLFPVHRSEFRQLCDHAAVIGDPARNFYTSSWPHLSNLLFCLRASEH